jgi:hypothetical protein
MKSSKVLFAFFIILSMTLNFGFFYGDMITLTHHNEYELFAAIIVGMIALALKLGDRSPMGNIQLATSLVSTLQLLTASIIWWSAGNVPANQINVLPLIVSLSGGAFLANIVSVIMLIVEQTALRK